MNASTEPTDPEQVVREFLRRLADEPERALALMDPAIEWRNSGAPTLRGARVHQAIRGLAESGVVGFGVEMTHVAASGPIVITQRTDVIEVGPVRTRFWVYGTFEVRHGKVLLWDDHFSWGAMLRSLAWGALTAPLRTGARRA
ncbi:MAG: limonene-1,2-epoxide hydrolase family protein [Nocardioides sp.]|nr:limonene-1,2-epoxide hydrolase family protein [Nocardioides sp.]